MFPRRFLVLRVHAEQLWDFPVVRMYGLYIEISYYILDAPDLRVGMYICISCMYII